MRFDVIYLHLVEIPSEFDKKLWTHFSLRIFTAIGSLLQHCFQLTILDVSGCANVTNASVELLALYCTSEDRPTLTCTVGGRNWSADVGQTGTTAIPCFHSFLNVVAGEIFFCFVLIINRQRRLCEGTFQVETFDNSPFALLGRIEQKRPVGTQIIRWDITKEARTSVPA